MRKIEIRAKAKENYSDYLIRKGSWVYGCGVKDNLLLYDTITVLTSDSSECQLLDELGPIGILIRVDKDTIGQYTGVRDKDNNKIYEGDICEYEFALEEIGVIKFVAGCFVWESRAEVRQLHLMNLGRLRVIGNIYDNPELLKM